ncbi:rifin PIR protein, putative [Plasmodium reichenowi]|uniref:Rifin PIR protein, putative n=1 Tax=Plasmodium reichenowi TaxID=5854 RepID=A0A2P9DSH0_PLARE|nr:rifin PIR protein, putative [Plasmodium reichenowi]
MKLYCSKILLFCLPLNIFLTSYHAHNKNKPSITLHHIQTNRSLCECDIQLSSYDKDVEMKSVREGFDRQTSQRFQEYGERMKDKRQKRKEERDKNIEQIIRKDKMEKSLAEKIEKGCLRCGCALGGGVLPVWGLVCGVGYAVWSQHATKLAIQKGIAEGLKVGLQNVMKIADTSSFIKGSTIPDIKVLETLIAEKFNDEVTLYGIFECINNNISASLRQAHEPFFATVKTVVQKKLTRFNIDHQVAAEEVTKAFGDAKALEFAANTSLLSKTIIASVVTIIIIVLIMVIIYLVLRYRRKKKMNKKAQYTKLLSQ